MKIEQSRQNVQRLQKRIDELQAFDPQSVTDAEDPELLALETAIRQTLSDVFGHGSDDWCLYQMAFDLDPGAQARGWERLGSLNGDGAYRLGAASYKKDVLESVTSGKKRALGLLRQAVSGLNERIEYAGRNAQSRTSEFGKKVFIVHGHDEVTRETVALFLAQLGCEPIILHKQPNKGRTILTKFRDEATDVGFAVVLMTPDDHGGKQNAETRPRARQNVVFELGFFIGVLGPERVAALVKGEVERPSDFDGVVYISLDHADWKFSLAKELKAAEFDVDLNKAIG